MVTAWRCQRRMVAEKVSAPWKIGSERAIGRFSPSHAINKAIKNKHLRPLTLLPVSSATYSASDQVVSEHGPVEKVLRFSSLEPRSTHPETALFRTFQRRSMGQIAEVAKNPTFWGPVRP